MLPEGAQVPIPNFCGPNFRDAVLFPGTLARAQASRRHHQSGSSLPVCTLKGTETYTLKLVLPPPYGIIVLYNLKEQINFQ